MFKSLHHWISIAKPHSLMLLFIAIQLIGLSL